MTIKNIKDRYILVYSDQILSTYKHSLIYTPELSESDNKAKQSDTLKKILDFRKVTYCLNKASFSIFDESWNVTEELQKARESIDKITKENSDLNMVLHAQVNLYEYRFFKKAIESDFEIRSPQENLAPSNYVMSQETFDALPINFLDFYKHFPQMEKSDILNVIKVFKVDEKASMHYFKNLPKKYKNDIDVCCAFVNKFSFFKYEKASISQTILDDPKFLEVLLNKNFYNLVNQSDSFKNYETIKKFLPLNFEVYSNSNLLLLDKDIDDSKNSLYQQIAKNYSRKDYLEHILLDASSINFFLNIPELKIDIPVITHVLFGYYFNDREADKTLSVLFRHFQAKNITFNDIETSEILEMLLEKQAFDRNKFFYSSNNFSLLTRINPKIKEMFENLVEEAIDKSVQKSEQVDISNVIFFQKISAELCKKVMLEDLKNQDIPKSKYKLTKF